MRKRTLLAVAVLLGGLTWLFLNKPVEKTVIGDGELPDLFDPLGDSLKDVETLNREQVAAQLSVNDPTLDVMLREGELIAFAQGTKFPVDQFKKDGQPYVGLPLIITSITPDFMPGSSEDFILWLDTPQTLLEGEKPFSLLKSNSRQKLRALAKENFLPKA